MHPDVRLLELTPSQFEACLPAITRIYAAAIGPPAAQIPARQSIMERHGTHPAFRAVIAARRRDDGGPGSAGVLGFAYGFHGEPGQWWHDLVHNALGGASGSSAADLWLGDSFEVAEVHVHPACQGRGIGHAMLTRLASDLAEPTAVLSTQDGDTRARRLYRGLGFIDLLTGFAFPGVSTPYSIMGAALPLRGTQPRPGIGSAPSFA